MSAISFRTIPVSEWAELQVAARFLEQFGNMKFTDAGSNLCEVFANYRDAMNRIDAIRKEAAE